MEPQVEHDDLMAKKKKKAPKRVVKPKPTSIADTLAPALPSTGKPNALGFVEKPGENWIDCTCFKCNGSTELCNSCGEARNVCSCEDDGNEPDFAACDNCNGTGKSRRLVDGGKSKS